jgi:hypothetical protein
MEEKSKDTMDEFTHSLIQHSTFAAGMLIWIFVVAAFAAGIEHAVAHFRAWHRERLDRC